MRSVLAIAGAVLVVAGAATRDLGMMASGVGLVVAACLVRERKNQ